MKIEEITCWSVVNKTDDDINLIPAGWIFTGPDENPHEKVRRCWGDRYRVWNPKPAAEVLTAARCLLSIRNRQVHPGCDHRWDPVVSKANRNVIEVSYDLDIRALNVLGCEIRSRN